MCCSSTTVIERTEIHFTKYCQSKWHQFLWALINHRIPDIESINTIFENIYYRLRTKVVEGNVFSHVYLVCLFTGRVSCDHYPGCIGSHHTGTSLLRPPKCSNLFSLDLTVQWSSSPGHVHTCSLWSTRLASERLASYWNAFLLMYTGTHIHIECRLFPATSLSNIIYLYSRLNMFLKFCSYINSSPEAF